MKRFLILAILACWHLTASAADLLEVYRQAQVSDPTFQQAISQRMATKEGVPISVAAILPTVLLTANPTISRYGYSGSNYEPVTAAGFGSNNFVFPRNTTQRTYLLDLSVTQTIFNFQQFSTIAQNVALSKGADATLNSAFQSLIIRVANAYFAVLKDEDNLSYADASKAAYAEQLDQANQQYKVGLKTQTDVYTAEASYDLAVSTYITAQTTLSNDKENLRVITGIYYPHLSALSDNFPLVSPRPRNVDEWVRIAQCQNWAIRTSEYNVQSARQIIKENEANNLPTVALQGTLSRQYTENINGYMTFSERNGPGTISDRAIGLNVNVPIFSGGQVLAQTNQAIYNYRVAQQQLEQTLRDTINTTRQSYFSIIAGISQVEADKQAIKSTISSLEGLEASYQVGTETLVDVLNQQQKVFQAQTTYATDRYAFVNNILALKQAAGTLSFDDLRVINAWLTEKESTYAQQAQLKGLGYKKHAHVSKNKTALSSAHGTEKSGIKLG